MGRLILRCTDKLGVLFQPFRQFSLIHFANFRGDDLTAFKNHQRRDAAHMKFTGRIGIILNIHFGDLHAAIKSFGDLFEGRSHFLTRATPFGPKVE